MSLKRSSVWDLLQWWIYWWC